MKVSFLILLFLFVVQANADKRGPVSYPYDNVSFHIVNLGKFKDLLQVKQRGSKEPLRPEEAESFANRKYDEVKRKWANEKDENLRFQLIAFDSVQILKNKFLNTVELIPKAGVDILWLFPSEENYADSANKVCERKDKYKLDGHTDFSSSECKPNTLDMGLNASEKEFKFSYLKKQKIIDSHCSEELTKNPGLKKIAKEKNLSLGYKIKGKKALLLNASTGFWYKVCNPIDQQIARLVLGMPEEGPDFFSSFDFIDVDRYLRTGTIDRFHQLEGKPHKPVKFSIYGYHKGKLHEMQLEARFHLNPLMQAMAKEGG